MKKGLAIQILTYAIPIIAVLFILTVVLKRVGLIQSGKERKVSAKEKQKSINLITSDALSPDKYKSTYNFERLTEQQVHDKAHEIHKAVWGWGTDEAAIYGVFKTLYNKLNVSQIADYYKQKYGESLRSALDGDLSTSELSIVDDLINALPSR